MQESAPTDTTARGEPPATVAPSGGRRRGIAPDQPSVASALGWPRTQRTMATPSASTTSRTDWTRTMSKAEGFPAASRSEATSRGQDLRDTPSMFAALFLISNGQGFSDLLSRMGQGPQPGLE